MYMNTVIKEVCKYNHSLCDLRCKLCQHGSWDDAIIHPSVKMDSCRCIYNHCKKGFVILTIVFSPELQLLT